MSGSIFITRLGPLSPAPKGGRRGGGKEGGEVGFREWKKAGRGDSRKGRGEDKRNKGLEGVREKGKKEGLEDGRKREGKRGKGGGEVVEERKTSPLVARHLTVWATFL